MSQGTSGYAPPPPPPSPSFGPYQNPQQQTGQLGGPPAQSGYQGQGSAGQGGYGPPGPPPPQYGTGPQGSSQTTGQQYQYDRTDEATIGNYYGGLSPRGQGGFYTQANPYTSQDPRTAYGGFDYGQQYYQNLYEGLANQYGSRNAPGVDYGQANMAYGNFQGDMNAIDPVIAQQQANIGQEQGLAGQLQSVASGQGQTAADIAFSQGLDRSMAAQQAQAASAGGGAGYALAQRSAAAQAGAQQAQGTAALGMQKFQEQRAAQEQLAGLYGQIGGQEQGITGQYLGAGQEQLGAMGQSAQMGQFGAQLGLSQEQLNQQGQLGAYGLEANMNQAQLQAYQNADIAQQQADTQRYGQTYISPTQAGGAAVGAVGAGAAMMSDIRAKQDIAPAGYGGSMGAPDTTFGQYKTPPSPWMGAGMSPAARTGISGTGTSMQAGMAPMGAQTRGPGGYALGPQAPGMGSAPSPMLRTQPRPMAMAARPSSSMRPMMVSDKAAKMQARAVGQLEERAAQAERWAPPPREVLRAAPGGGTRPLNALTVMGQPHTARNIYSQTGGGPYAPIAQPPARPMPPPPPAGAIASDENGKQRTPHTYADAYLDTLKPYSYRYRNPNDEPTDLPTADEYLGVMAQDVERGPTGRTLVKESPRGKALDLGPNLSATMAGLGRLNERVRALEGDKSGRR